MHLIFPIKKYFFLFFVVLYYAISAEIMFSQSTATLVGELNNVIHPILTSPLLISDAELTCFDSFANCQIIGLGEATHGTKEFFQMKHRLFKYFVEKHGFKVFGFEADMGECIYIDRFICKGIGTINEVMDKMYFWTWKTEEVKELILWMKSYNENKTADQQIHFLGFDCQTIRHVHNILTEYLSRCNITPRVNQERILDELNAKSASFSTLTSIEVTLYKAKCDSVISLLEGNELTAAAIDEFEFKQMKQLMIQAKQVIDVAKQSSSGLRDKYMAENAIWFSNLFGVDSKIALWAHNGHIGKNPAYSGSGSMGNNIKASIGNQYKVIGFSFNNGSFRAVNYSTETGTYTGLINHYITKPSPSNSINYIFMLAEPKTFALVLGEISPLLSLKNWLNSARPFLSIGSIYSSAMASSYFYSQNLTSYFDSIIHFHTTNAAVGYINVPISITNSRVTTPVEFILHQNYPNPFNPTTNIKFSIPTESKVKMKIFNSLGKEIEVIYNGQLSPGTHSIQWNGADYASGVYFYRLETENMILTNKMLLLK